jgi:hypothetical protein
MKSALLSLFAVVLIAAAPPPAPKSGPPPIADFTKDMKPQSGLFTLWRKDGKLYIEISKNQLDTDFIQTAEPASGLGGYGVTVGLPYIQMARTMRFSRTGDKIVITWPNTSFVAGGNDGASQAVSKSFAPSVMAVTPIVAEDTSTGDVIFDASPFAGDVIDMQDYLRLSLDTDHNPMATYRLDPQRSFFGESKAFPDNVIVEADQTWASEAPLSDAGAILDNVTDPRSVQIKIKYNITQAPALGSYTPRIADDRVGYIPTFMLDYSRDNVQERQLRYILRWDIARHPMVYYIANDVPPQYRATIRSALLTWNSAFARLGYPNAVQVLDQPNDPNWDEDDIRYNTVHWLTQSNSGGYAQAGVVYDPRTGQLLKTSIVIDADLMFSGYDEAANFAGPARQPAHGFAAEEAAFASGARDSMNFGLWAMRGMGLTGWNSAPPGYAQQFLRYIVLHESGHNWGLQHNFIATEAYTNKDLQSMAFTSRNGVSASVMDYIPANIWPKGTSNGAWFQNVLGPYDYYVIHWGYAPVPGAHTPQAELPTLRQWASAWSDPRFRYENDEDVMWGNGHAIDPRVNHWDLSNDNLTWCQGQLQIGENLMRSLASRYNVSEATHDPLRTGFRYAMSPFNGCAYIAAHYIGGEYLSRAHIGDPHSSLPLQAVPRSQSQRAFVLLDRYMLGEHAWKFSPRLLRSMVYTEWITDFSEPQWAYDFPQRHDLPVATIVEGYQTQTLGLFFNPTTLQRLDDASLKYKPGQAMSLTDLFAWTHHAVFGDLTDGAVASAGEIHRNLQQWYARKLAQLVLSPAKGTPYDAQSLARADLVALQGEIAHARHAYALDALAQAHLASLAAVVGGALSAKTVLPPLSS